MGILKVFAILLVIGVVDVFILDGINHDPVAAPDVGVHRVGLHQGKNEAYFLYFFIAHIYDNILNPWHWTEEMRQEALTSGDFGLEQGMKVADVGCGTGFTTIGVTEQGVLAADIHMLDQSPQQLSKAVVKPQLQGVAEMLEGDSQNLPANWTGKFDRYTSAGSIEYWPQPQEAIDESARILKPGGKAMIIGPVRATNPVSRFFCDLWYLFPEEGEYIEWFTAAGYKDIQIHAITPSWYKGDRSHGLIMGFAVVGTKPLDWEPIKRATPMKAGKTIEPGSDSFYNSKMISLLLSLPRSVLGMAGGAYYAILPIVMYMKYIWFGGSAAATTAAIVLPLLALVFFEVLPLSWTPLSASPRLYNGIRDFYNSSSAIWIKVWGEHMHTGFYEIDVDESKLSMDDHRAAQDRMMEELFALWDNVDDVLAGAAKATKTVRVLDMGCGVGGSSRFLWKSLTKKAADRKINIEVTGITLSDYQVSKAESLTKEQLDTDNVTFKVMNALETKFDENFFDCVWSLESGEHMPNKSNWLKEVNRILIPGGTFLCATWCHRSTVDKPLETSEKRLLQRLCKNYNLPEWVSLETYEAAATENKMANFSKHRQSWNEHITPFWPAVISSALKLTSILRVIFFGNWTIIKGAISAFLMKQGFEDKILDFGVFTLNKAK
eukprot:m.92273 g.92273  ORF g.92273 m.92273 type:complete len:663 (+) comp26534_c0_seq1:103-2091(+)